ncbi:hypothetical protein [Haliangium sp. UPWRP_2]|uniref:hypothetical protein n=1 Tax=Haliangium sp. UPWRP_2 TaxID=1931276 RepID=UPI000B546552|nr:hypothetical protein [Haliangium sp. UPWRP_2]PSM31784.1 hypothetical protein BVG81_003660 [Haliangium sp. UPWRP_2]
MSDLGQETRGQPQRAPPPPAAPVVATPAPAATAATAGGTGKGDARSLATLFSGLSDPKTSTPLQGDKRSEGKFPSWTSQNWRSLGGSVVGNRLADTPQLDPKKPELPAKIKNATIGGPPVGNVDLTGLKVESSNKGGDGFYHDSTSGTLALAKPGSYKYNKDGESADLYTARAVAGAREQVGVRANAKVAGRYGEAKAGADAFALAEAGADANASFGSNGLQASANTSARAGVGVKGDADLKSAPLLNIEGVDPVTAGIGTHADGFAGGRIGGGVKAGISPKFTGFEGKLGGFAGAEGNIDAHASLGPLRAKIGASGFAGIGAEASGRHLA